jgi:hypothetical protein
MPCACAALVFLGLPLLSGLPRTLRVEINEWRNTSWGFHAISRNETRCVIAVSADGSRRNKCESRSFHHYAIPDGNYLIDTLYLRLPNRIYVIEQEKQKAIGQTCGCEWKQPEEMPRGSNCADVAQTLGARTLAGFGSIAGQKVVRYRDVDDDESVVELALAMDSGCEVMEETRTYPGTLAIPGARWQYIVTSFKSGEPEPEHFHIPAGYKIEERPGWR